MSHKPSELHDAVKRGDLATVRKLLQKMNVKAPNAAFQTPLHVAAIENQIEVLIYLIKKGAPLDCTDRDNLTPLHYACHSDHLDIVDHLVGNGARGDIPSSSGIVALHYFVRMQSQISKPIVFERVFNTLLKRGSNVCQQDSRGDTPLHYASGRNKNLSVRLLIRENANPDMANKGGETPLMLAARGGYLDTVQLLIESKADLMIKGPSGVAMEVAVEAGHREVAWALHDAMFPAQKIPAVIPQPEIATTHNPPKERVAAISPRRNISPIGISSNNTNNNSPVSPVTSPRNAQSGFKSNLRHEPHVVPVSVSNDQSPKRETNNHVQEQINAAVISRKISPSTAVNNENNEKSNPNREYAGALQSSYYQKAEAHSAHTKKTADPTIELGTFELDKIVTSLRSDSSNSLASSQDPKPIIVQRRNSNVAQGARPQKSLNTELAPMQELQPQMISLTPMEVQLASYRPSKMLETPEIIDFGQNHTNNKVSLEIPKENLLADPERKQQLSRRNTPKKEIKSYVIGDCVGSGAFGKVYKAMNKEIGCTVAVKVLDLESTPPRQCDAAMMELDLLKRLSHSHIVQYIDFVHQDNYLYIFLEFLEGGSLRDAVEKYGMFSEQLVKRYLRQILEGLDYLHDQGIIHRDIKGANVLSTRDGDVKLADFGISIAAEEKDHEGTKAIVNTLRKNKPVESGSPYWMAPEVILSKTSTTKADIWSMGITIIELLTGNPPHYEKGAMSAMFNITKGPPPIPANVSKECADFLSLCFIMDPEQRPGVNMLLQHPFVKSELSLSAERNCSPGRAPQPVVGFNMMEFMQLQQELQLLQQRLQQCYATGESATIIQQEMFNLNTKMQLLMMQQMQQLQMSVLPSGKQ